MTRTVTISRVGQPFPIRTDPVSPAPIPTTSADERAIRRLNREAKKDQINGITNDTTETISTRFFDAQEQRQHRESMIASVRPLPSGDEIIPATPQSSEAASTPRPSRKKKSKGKARARTPSEDQYDSESSEDSYNGIGRRRHHHRQHRSEPGASGQAPEPPPNPSPNPPPSSHTPVDSPGRGPRRNPTPPASEPPPPPPPRQPRFQPPRGPPSDPGDDDDDPDDESSDSESRRRRRRRGHRSRRSRRSRSRSRSPSGGYIRTKDLSALIKAITESTGELGGDKSGVKARDPDTYDGSSDEKLRIFVYQCDLYFMAQPKKFKEDTAKVAFAISFLRGSAMSYFRTFGASRDVIVAHDFLHNWKAFITKLNNLFGSFNPEDEDEDAIHRIAFPNDGKATEYFIKFAEYQNRVSFDDRSLRYIVRRAIPERIRAAITNQGLRDDTFEQLRQAVLKVDSQYWSKKSREENERKEYQALQAKFSKYDKKNNSSSSSAKPSATSNDSASKSNSNSSNNSNSNNSNNGNNKNKPKTSTTPGPKPEHLGPDGKLTATEKDRRVKEGLCLICATKGHMARDCPRSRNNNSSSSNNKPAKARAATATEPLSSIPEATIEEVKN